MDFEAIRVDAYPLDAELTDTGFVGPELSAAAHAYLATPRALIWRNPSPDWKLFVLLLPLASRLSLMANPIFAQLTRDWGHTVRFVGVDRHQCVYDFRSLLTDATLRRLVAALAQWLHAADGRDGLPARAAEADGRDGLPARAAEAATLDVLFAALGDNMLTILETSPEDWGRHLAREHRLEPQAPGSLFDRASRYPDFVAQLRHALRHELIDVTFYGRVLRSMDLREASAEQRAAALIEGTLDPVTLVKLGRTRTGRHLGCYNWLLTAPRHAAQRAYVLGKLPAFAQFFAESLIDARPRRRSGLIGAAEGDARLASRGADARDLLRQAVDSGQDRRVVEALSAHLGVQQNVVRALWRHCPSAIGAPPSWHLRQILLRLDELPERAWPRDDAQWLEFASRSVPAIAH